MESQEQIDNANLLLTQHRLKLEWNQMVWSVNNLRCGTADSNSSQLSTPLWKLWKPRQITPFSRQGPTLKEGFLKTTGPASTKGAGRRQNNFARDRVASQNTSSCPTPVLGVRMLTKRQK